MADEIPKKQPPTIPGKIIQVSYGMTVNIGNFENIRFDLTAQVALDEDWREVLEALRTRSRRIKKRYQEEDGAA
jgi:hypothetical protein